MNEIIEERDALRRILVDVLDVREDGSLSVDELLRRLSYHKPERGQAEIYKKIRRAALDFGALLTVRCPESRELSLAMTKLEESVMWANAAIARRS